MYSCYSTHTIGGRRFPSGEPLENGVYLVGEKTITVLNGELLPIYSADLFRVEKVFGLSVLIGACKTLNVIFDGGSIIFSDGTTDIGEHLSFKYRREGEYPIIFIYKECVWAGYGLHTCNYDGTLQFPHVVVHKLRPTRDARFSDDAKVEMLVAGKWRKVPYSVIDGTITLHHPIVACGVKFGENDPRCFYMQ